MKNHVSLWPKGQACGNEARPTTTMTWRTRRGVRQRTRAVVSGSMLRIDHGQTAISEDGRALFEQLGKCLIDKRITLVAEQQRRMRNILARHTHSVALYRSMLNAVLALFGQDQGNDQCSSGAQCSMLNAVSTLRCHALVWTSLRFPWGSFETWIKLHAASFKCFFRSSADSVVA